MALANQCLPQCDTFFKEAIKLVQDLPAEGPPGRNGKRPKTEPRLVDFLLGFAGSLVVVPGQPGDAGGPFYLARRFAAEHFCRFSSELFRDSRLRGLV